MSNRRRAPGAKVAIPEPAEPGEPKRYEWLFANPVMVDRADGEGIYCLLNTAFWSPFGLGDLVNVRRIDGHLEVVSLRQRGTRVSYYLALAETADAAEFQSLCDAWRRTGTWIEGLCEHRVVVSVEESVPGFRPTYDELEALERTAPLCAMVVMAMPEDEPDDADLFGHLAG